MSLRVSGFESDQGTRNPKPETRNIFYVRYKITAKYGGLLDRVSFYFPLVPGENEAGWRAVVDGFKEGS